MNLLILDTAIEQPFISFVQETKTLTFDFLPNKKNLSQILTLKVMKQDSIPDAIAVGTGPGSLTASRIGIAFVKGLALGWNIPLIGFHSLEGFLPTQKGPFAVVMKNKSATCYIMEGDSATHLPLSFHFLQERELTKQMKSNIYFLGTQPTSFFSTPAIFNFEELKKRILKKAQQSYTSPIQLQYLSEIAAPKNKKSFPC